MTKSEEVKMTMNQQKILKKTSLLKAKAILNGLSYLKLIDFEYEESHWIELFEHPLKQFRQVDSKPSYTSAIVGSPMSTVWLEGQLHYFKGKQEWLIAIPDCILPVWANVKVLGFTNALQEIWTKFGYDIIVADKSEGVITQVFIENTNYEVHMWKCEQMNESIITTVTHNITNN